ncbi:MAG: 16S rRNA (adenine(1518)-N(6)/adenine(1519)-N(6))-dimethyltransferase RsmA [Actinobacteria bacterium]|nr:16S rRNA (adenine(1518)-N(6)/adenine(1519)-N(6))-dimethyltransferase RsmA [Actinomycetota bacterium]
MESRGGSSTSRRRPSPSSPRSGRGSSRSRSSGDGTARTGLTLADLRDLAERHGIRPTKALGQHFLADPNLARAIVADAGVKAGDRILEIGAGLGSLTVPLSAAGAHVLAVELDRALVPALEEVVAGLDVRVVTADAVAADWASLLEDGPWSMVSNLPYNVAVPVVMRLLEEAPGVDPLVVMVQREVGERLAAGPGEDAYGSVSARVAYRANASLVRRVPPPVFWPRPTVESVIVRLDRRPPPVETPAAELFRVIEEGFAQRRKTMRNALVRLGLSADEAAAALADCGLEPNVRAEDLGLDAFDCLTRSVAR